MNRSQFRGPGEIRKQHNNELIRRMRKGESLTTFDSQASWFPPRPIIEKDQSEIARLYRAADKGKKTPVHFDHAGEDAENRARVVFLGRRVRRDTPTWDDAG